MKYLSKEQLSAYVILILGVLGFSIKAIFIKLGYLAGVSTNSLFILRMMLSLPFYLLVLFLYAWKKDTKTKLQNKQVLWFLVISGISYYITSLSDMYGLKFVTVAIERTILFTFPSIVAILSIIVLGKAYGKRLFLSLVICYAGVILTIYSGINFSQFNNNTPSGILLIFISVISYAVFYVISEKAVQIIDPNVFNTIAMIIACFLTVLLNLRLFHQNLFGFSYHVYILALLMAIFSTVLPSFLIMKSISQLGATTVSIFNNLSPFITLFAGYLVLDEKITWMELSGTLMVIYGILYLKKAKNND